MQRILWTQNRTKAEVLRAAGVTRALITTVQKRQIKFMERINIRDGMETFQQDMVKTNQVYMGCINIRDAIEKFQPDMGTYQTREVEEKREICTWKT